MENAKTAINKTKQVIKRAKSLNILPDEKALKKAKICIENGTVKIAAITSLGLPLEAIEINILV